MSLLLKKLAAVKGKDVVVTMNDGVVFKGTLVDFDETAMVLKEVCESDRQEIHWHVEGVSNDDFRDLYHKVMNGGRDNDVDGPSSDQGYIAWREVALPEVYLNISQVSRVWPWCSACDDKKGRKSKQSPVYYKKK